jgi:formiminotetrahydrofolate cyclodeaminase
MTGPGERRPPAVGGPGGREPAAAVPGGPHEAGTGRAGYLDMRVGEFLDELAAARPAPGGGSAAALTVALAAALCAMTAELSTRQLAEAPQLAAESRGLLRRAAPLAQADADAYGGVLAARREPGQPGGPQREERVSAALARASGVPLEVAELGDRVAALAADVAGRGNPAVRGDALAAAQLAAAAAQTAAALVQINLARMPADPRPARAARLAAHAARLAARATGQPGSQDRGPQG